MRNYLLLLVTFISTFAFANAQTESIVDEELVFQERNGIVAVEAEHFYKQSQSDVRQWYRYSKDVWPKVGMDLDDPHCVGASNNSYIEILPDTRVTHGEELIVGENFSGEAGQMAVVHYKINFKTKGRYYVWVRAFSTGSEDNGLHVGIDGEWPETGQRMQWCEGKQSWRWESKQRREENHCGIPYLIYLDIDKKGEHEIMFSMREDGFEFDKFLMTTDKDYTPEGVGPEPVAHVGEIPQPFPQVEIDLSRKRSVMEAIRHDVMGARLMPAIGFSTFGSHFYQHNHWLAINPNKHKEATALQTVKKTWTRQTHYDLVFIAVGENDGQSEYAVNINDQPLGKYKVPLSEKTFEVSSKHCKVWENVRIKEGDIIRVDAKVGTDGKEYSRGRWEGIVIVPLGQAKNVLKAIDENNLAQGKIPAAEEANIKYPTLDGELKKWHKVSLTFDGPETSENDEFNPFTNYRFEVNFWHPESGKRYTVPGYFAADGNAGETSATSGNKWRVHFAPDEVGQWTYQVNFRKGKFAAMTYKANTGKSGGYMDGAMGTFTIAPSDKTGRDLRGKGMLQYVGERYLKFAETGEYFLKVGSDAPENMLSYADFDGTFHNDGHKDQLVKTWEAHLQHWNEGDPTWQGDKGKAIIGAVNYLSSKGMNAFSFITNNIGGDDQNVFPYIDYDTYDRIDCSKMDQWETLFEHADKKGMFLHFKLLEHENQGLLDNGGVGANTKVYYREMIARFGHHLALNWNMCEENGDWGNVKTAPQSKWERWSMAGYFETNDPYQHHRVIHNGLQFDDLLGETSPYTGVSVQTSNSSFLQVHGAVKRWIEKSEEAGKQWAVACDEPGDASHSLLPDAVDADHDNARMNGLWGTFLAGGWGTEWYFGYKHAHSDLTCQDYASRDKFWDQGKHLLDFFQNNAIPFWEMKSMDELVKDHNYCFAKAGEVYVVLLKKGRGTLDLQGAKGEFQALWFNPKTGEYLKKTPSMKGGAEVELKHKAAKEEKDWVVLLQKL